MRNFENFYQEILSELRKELEPNMKVKGIQVEKESGNGFVKFFV